MEETKKILGIVMPFQINDRACEIYPIRIKDWVNFAPYVDLWGKETLQEIYYYVNGDEALKESLRILTRTEEGKELDPMFLEMTQADYERLRKIIMEQNDLRFDTLETKGKREGKDQPSV